MTAACGESGTALMRPVCSAVAISAVGIGCGLKPMLFRMSIVSVSFSHAKSFSFLRSSGVATGFWVK